MNRQLTMVICRQLIQLVKSIRFTLIKRLNGQVLTRLTQYVPWNKANMSLCYLLASYKWEDFGATLQHMWSICVLIISFIGWARRAGVYTKRNMLTEVNHIGHKFAKYCCLKLAGSIMKYWLCFVAHVGWSELDVWLLY